MNPIIVTRFVDGQVHGSQFDFEPSIVVCVMSTDPAKRDDVYRIGSELAQHRNTIAALRVEVSTLRARVDALLGDDAPPTPRVTPVAKRALTTVVRPTTDPRALDRHR